MIDLIIEKATVKKYFECLEVPENQKNEDVKNIMKIIETFEDENA